MDTQVPNPKVLVIDDEIDILELLKITLSRMGLTVYTAENLGSAKLELSKNTFKLCLTDMKLPDGDGLELVEYINREYPNTPVAIITAFGTINHAVEALKKGAFDFVTKPLSIEVLRALVINALKLPDQIATADTDHEKNRLVGDSKAVRALNAQLKKLARSQAAVFLNGETGTGKDLVARIIHENSTRRHHRFAALDLATLDPEDMAEEIFGSQQQAGLLEKANGGTVFIDNIHLLPGDLQIQLLHAIGYQKIIHPKTQQDLHLDVRYITAADKPLEEALEDGSFRKELYYRLNVIPLNIPPLRERIEDIPDLVRHLLRVIGREWGKPPCKISPEALQKLQEWDYPGNIRELRQILERAVTLCEGDCIRPQDLCLDDDPHTVPPASMRRNQSLEEYIENIERAEITKALEKANGNKTRAAELLGLSFRALRYRIKKLGLD